MIYFANMYFIPLYISFYIVAFLCPLKKKLESFVYANQTLNQDC